MVEFALILGVLLLFIFVVIDGSRILWANLTVQNAARSGGRYAITGQFDPECLDNPDPCDDPRVASIKATALEAMSGLNLDPDAGFYEPSFYAIEVFGTDESGTLIQDFAGIPGGTVIVRVIYRQETLTPLLRPIAETVRVFGQVTFTNERFSQVETSGSVEVPPPPPLPTLGPTPTPLPPDVTVSKSDSRDPVIGGEEFSYTIDVTNIGGSTAEGVTLTDNLPGGVAAEADSVADAGCSGTATITCNLPDIGAGSSASVSFVVSSTVDSDATVTNTVSVAATGEISTTNNSATESTFVDVAPTDADLEISKSVFPAPPADIVPGRTINFSILVTNHGLVTAEDVQVIDDMPGDAADFSNIDVPDDCSYDVSNHSVTCNRGQLLRDETWALSITMEAVQAGNYTNNVGVTSITPDPNPGNETASVDFTVTDEADVGIVKGGPHNPGATIPFTYTLSVHNNGPYIAQDVVVEDTLPPELELLAVTTTKGSCTPDFDDGEVSCPIGSLAAGENAFIRIRVVTDTPGTYKNTATVSTSSTEPEDAPNNNSSTEFTQVRPRIDLSISKTSSSDDVVVGEEVNFAINVENLSQYTANDVVITDVLSDTVNYVSATPSRGACEFAGGTVTCRVQSVDPGDTVTIDLVVVPFVANEEVVNAAEVDATEIDIDRSNNRDSVSFRVRNAPTPEVITLTPACGNAGDAFDVNGYFWGTGGNSDLVVEWIGSGPAINLATFQNAASTWTVTTAVPAGVTDGTYTVRATRGNKSAEAQFIVPCPGAELTVSDFMTDTESGAIVAGESVTFTATVSNEGVEDAVEPFYVSLYFDPQGITLNSSTHITGTYRQASLTLDGLAQGESRAITFTVSDGFPTSGQHEAYIVVDSDPGPTGRIDEASEVNNLSQISVHVEADDNGLPEPEPTPTPEPETLGTWSGLTTILETGENLGLARLRFLDGTTVIAETYSDAAGFFSVDLPAGDYTANACVDVYDAEGNLVNYAAITSPQTITAGETLNFNVKLPESPAGTSCAP